jgi:hypothetical protein
VVVCGSSYQLADISRRFAHTSHWSRPPVDSNLFRLCFAALKKGVFTMPHHQETAWLICFMPASCHVALPLPPRSEISFHRKSHVLTTKNDNPLGFVQWWLNAIHRAQNLNSGGSPMVKKIAGSKPVNAPVLHCALILPFIFTSHCLGMAEQG